jgi:uncharacterized ion transporter superfamily protein YfcC
LSFTKVGWGTWVRWSIKAQVVMAVLALLFLGIAVKVGFGPY